MGYYDDDEAMDSLRLMKGVSGFAGDSGSVSPAQRAVNLQKGQIDVMKGMRELAGPGPREKFQAQQEQFQITKMFEMFTSLAKEKDLSEPSRDVLRGMMASVYHGLPKMLQAGLAPWMTADFLSKEQMAEREFERTTPKIDKPRGADGAPLVRTAENRMQWLEYDILSRERNRNKQIVKWGKEKGEGMVPMPQFWDARASDDNPGDMWMGYKDPITQQIGVMNLDKTSVSGLKQALDKGWTTMPDYLRSGMFPEMEPVQGVLDGMKVQTTTWFNSKTGQRELETRPVGATNAEVDKTLPKEVMAAMFAVNSGDPDTYLKNVKDPTTLALASAMKEIEGIEAFQTKDGQVVENPEFWGKMGKLQGMIEQAWPGVKWQAFQRTDFEQGDWNANMPAGIGGGGFTLGSGKWFFKRTDKQVTFRDLNGTPGVFNWDSSRQVAFDKYGEDVPESQGLPEGTVLQIPKFSKPGELSEDQKWAQETSWEGGELAEGTVGPRAPEKKMPGAARGGFRVGPQYVGIGLAQDAARLVKHFVDIKNSKGEAEAVAAVQNYIDSGGGDIDFSPEVLQNITGFVLADINAFLHAVKTAYRQKRSEE